MMYSIATLYTPENVYFSMVPIEAMYLVVFFISRKNQ